MLFNNLHSLLSSFSKENLETSERSYLSLADSERSVLRFSERSRRERVSASTCTDSISLEELQVINVKLIRR